MDLINSLREASKTREVWLWGIQYMGRVWSRVFEAAGITFAGFISSRVPQNASGHLGYPLKKASEILGRESDDFFILIATSPQSEGEIVLTCHKAGLVKYKHFLASSDICATPLDEGIRRSFALEAILSPDSPPPNLVPTHLLPDYTRGGVPIIHCYYNCNGGVKVRNSSATYEAVFEQLRTRTLDYYGCEVNSFYDLLEAFSFQNRSVLVWGLAWCNCEAMAVWKGAERVYVVDYNLPVCEHDTVEVMRHDEWLARNLQVDMAFSFSSFEHDGLGAYGDPLDPDGDFRAMREAWISLKDGGVLFLGLPLGRECLIWNLHRVYGPKRLAKILRGWACEAVFNSYTNDLSPDFPFDRPLGQQYQPVLVLRKITTENPDPAWLLDEIKKSATEAKKPRTSTYDPVLRLTILRIQAEDFYERRGEETIDRNIYGY